MIWIDRILSRFSIRTKVVVLVLPFVLSISAVGLVGVLSSAALQNRIAVASAATTSLRGFKDVYAAMIAFLSDTSEQSRAALQSRLSEQEKTLDIARIGLNGKAEGVSDLADALAQVSAIRARMDTLWQVHRREQALENKLNAAMSVVVSSQAVLQQEAAAYEKTIRAAEQDARERLRQADKILAATALAGVLRRDFLQASDDAARLKALAANLDELKLRHKLMAAALPKDAKAAGKDFSKRLKTLKALLDAEPRAPDAAAGALAELDGLMTLSPMLDAAATTRMKDVSATFAELEGQLAKSELVTQDARRVVDAAFLARIAYSSFMLDRSETKRNALAEQIALCRKAMFSLEGTAGDLAFAKQQSALLLPALDAIDSDSAALIGTTAERAGLFAEATRGIDAVGMQLAGFAENQKIAAEQEGSAANALSLVASLAGVAIAILSGGALVYTLRGPIERITGAMRRVADGALDTVIVGSDRRDEIGDMARALDVFKSNALTKRDLERRSVEEQLKTETERRRHEADRERRNAEIAEAVEALAFGLDSLARGRLAISLDTPFAGQLDKLRLDFNASVGGLRDTLVEIRGASVQIQENGVQMTESAKALAVRTEQQAASLEETAAAVDGIHTTVRRSAQQAGNADLTVGSARRAAENSSIVVDDATRAMQRIQSTSGRIARIIDVIDEIAFQINLLALNAGIEAARAGEAGRGFAVVAQEVRELAHRSSVAAKEISDLIGNSTREVEIGADLVSRTGAALLEISDAITSISAQIGGIAQSSREQSASIAEVNEAVGRLDQLTQRNAAMAEETEAATFALSGEADRLMSLVGRFELERAESRRLRAA
ncbi:HAMP domain-containing methyl-accepting chemotaxis protein [Rhizobium sp. G21]|uniref:methyl-accepting chemotaxis protein n=1 Tax=Rhizobium sp. G21 TaxID=2758439 RepID=UPI0015FF14CA|nr:HAMP domain-containing methyl-accepting chemotaxis protein [Rhizobium sp. G21]MBB1248725.1 HAMP domain-containing protein [Rhizobium sp. G21]